MQVNLIYLMMVYLESQIISKESVKTFMLH